MVVNQEGTQFEFLLTLENNIIVQRYFFVNNYNPKSKNSLNLYYWITDTCNEISNILKMKNLEYMSDNYHYITENEEVKGADSIKEEYFKLEIKLDNHVFISRCFPAHVYHPKARYCDIRPQIKKMLGDVTNVLSAKDKELDKTYLNYELK